MPTPINLPALYAARARAERLADELDQLIADIEVTLDGYPSPVLIQFIDPMPTDSTLAGGAAVFHISGGVYV